MPLYGSRARHVIACCMLFHHSASLIQGSRLFFFFFFSQCLTLDFVFRCFISSISLFHILSSCLNTGKPRELLRWSARTYQLPWTSRPTTGRLMLNDSRAQKNNNTIYWYSVSYVSFQLLLFGHFRYQALLWLRIYHLASPLKSCSLQYRCPLVPYSQDRIWILFPNIYT